MIREFEILKSYNLKAESSFARPVQVLPKQVKLDDPAISALTDFNKVSLVVARPTLLLEVANSKMIRYGVRALIVLNSNDQVAGLLTASDILGEKQMRFLQNMGGTHADIMVRDIMTPQHDLEYMKIEDVQNACVGQIVATLKKAGRQHGLVVSDGADGKQMVCGIFSLTQIAKLLGAPLDHVLAEIESVVVRSA
jgi:CBS-domain-containing membrane protein